MAHTKTPTRLTSLDVLHVFLSVAESGGFTASANKLNIPVATVSRKIAQLERELRVTLFVRNTRNVRLSPEGEVFYAQVAPALSNVQDAINQLSHDVQALSGVIRITAPSDLVNQHLTAVFARFLRLNPDVSLHFHLNTDIMNLVSEHIDLAIRAGALADSGLYARHLFDVRLKLFATPEYLAAMPAIMEPAQLLDCNLLTLKTIHTLSFQRAGIAHKIPIKTQTGNVQANEMNTLIAFCIAGTGVALLPDVSVRSYVAQGQLVEILPDCIFDAVPIHALTPEKNPPARVRRLIEHLKEQQDAAYFINQNKSQR